MNYALEDKKETRDRLKSGLITAAIWTALLVFLFLYKVVEKMPEKREVETRMLINFGDNRNGNGVEEPANQEGSLAAAPAPAEVPQPATEQPAPVKETVIEKKAEPKPAKEKVITGNDIKRSVPLKKETDKKGTSSAKATATKTTKPTGAKSATANSKTGTGDGKGTAAIGNLIRGRGTKAGTQGTNGTVGNDGDPLGGDGNGDSRIGVDRQLTGFIPGTMGRGGAQPTHSCTASGSITIAYTVDKAGNVISARRAGGISDPCVTSTSVSWVKKYVKAEKASSPSTGTYRITF